MKYNKIITNLENIIENWYDKDELVKYIKYPEDGLCDNIRTIIQGEPIPRDSITSWVYYNCNPYYPVGGEGEYTDGMKTPYSLFDNPKRLHLAVHMLQWFRQHNV